MNEFVRKNKTWIGAGFLLLVLVVIYMVCLNRSMLRYVEVFEEKYGNAEPMEVQQGSLYQVPGYHELLKERGRLDGLVKMARNDSVNLFLNLADKEAQLMIKGLGVRTIPLELVKTDVLFRRASEEALYNWLSEPLQIVADWSSIPKEPVNVVIAPKDSSDEAPVVVPDTLQKEPVAFILETNRDLRLYFYQTTSGDGWAMFGWNGQYRWRETLEHIKTIFSFHCPEYTPVVFIGLNKEEAKVLYRAIPRQGQMVITF